LRRLFCFASELYIPRCFAAAPRGLCTNRPYFAHRLEISHYLIVF